MTIMRNLWHFFHIIYLFGIISGDSDNSNFDEEIYELTNEIFENYFQAFRCITYAADDARNSDRVKKILPWLVIDLSAWGQDAPPGNVLREAFEQGCGAVIVQTKADNRPAVVRALRDAKNEAVSNRYNRERYLFLPASSNDSDVELLRDDEMMFFFPNLLLVSSDASSGEFLVNGHAVFDPGRSDPVEVLDSWTSSKGFQRGIDLYPDRLKNVKGKELIFGLIQYVPYSIIVYEGNKTIYDGVETRMAAIFLETINGTFVGMDHPVELWGNKLPNGSWNGFMGSVQRHKADLGYSAVYQWDCDALDCSYPYMLAQVTFLVPKPKILTSWVTILLPFSNSTWIALSIAYIISCCFVFSIDLATRRLKGAGISGHVASTAFQSAFHVFRLQMQQIPKAAHKNHPVAIFTKISLLLYFSISVFWQGGLSSILTVPRYEKPINSPADIVERWPKVKWGSNTRLWLMLVENSKDPILREIVEKFQLMDDEDLEKRASSQDFGYFMEKLPNDHYGFSSHINEKTAPYLRLMKHGLYTAHVVMALPRGSPYTEKFDHVVRWLYDTGITQKIEVQVSLERSNNHLQKMIRLADEKESGRAVLTVNHIQGSLYVYFGGILISTAAFFIEKILKRNKPKRRHEGTNRVIHR